MSILICFIQIKLFCFILLIIYLFFIINKNKIVYQLSWTINSLDYFIGLICITEIIICLFSIYKLSSIEFLLKILLLTAFYFFVCIIIRFQKQINFVINFVSILSGILALIAIVNFLFHAVFFVSNGLDDLTCLKHFYHPLGKLSNDWATTVLCFLPFSFYSFHILEKQQRWICVVISSLVLFSLLITLSRGAILSAISFFMSLVIFTFLFKREKFTLLFIQILAIISMVILLCIPLKKSLYTTMALIKTPSQIRSIDGRFSKWQEACYIFKQYPIIGVGSGNYALASDMLSIREKKAFNPRCTNTFLQILSEKGIVGIITYGSFWLCTCIVAFKKIKSGNFISLVFFSAFIALLTREMTFSSLFEDNVILTLSMLMVFFISSPVKEDSVKYSNSHE